MLGPLPVWAWALATAVLGGSFLYGRKHGLGSVAPLDTSLNAPTDLAQYPGVYPSGGSSSTGYAGSPIVNPGTYGGGAATGGTGQAAGSAGLYQSPGSQSVPFSSGGPVTK